jgi:hypothetical protein
MSGLIQVAILAILSLVIAVPAYSASVVDVAPRVEQNFSTRWLPINVLVLHKSCEPEGLLRRPSLVCIHHQADFIPNRVPHGSHFIFTMVKPRLR